MPCRLRRQALSAIRVAIHLIVRILDPSREFYAARLASGNQPTRVDVSAANTAYPSPENTRDDKKNGKGQHPPVCSSRCSLSR